MTLLFPLPESFLAHSLRVVTPEQPPEEVSLLHNLCRPHPAEMRCVLSSCQPRILKPTTGGVLLFGLLCSDRVPVSGWLMNNRHLFFTALDAGRLVSVRAQSLLVLSGPHMMRMEDPPDPLFGPEAPTPIPPNTKHWRLCLA